MSSIEVRDVRPDDEGEWSALYRGYRDFYRLPDDEVAIATTWSWISGRQHGLRGLVAVGAAGDLIALAHLRTFARPSAAAFGLYLDDLFTAPASRGSGAANALLARAAEIAADEGATVVRWITAEDNATARRVYDANATATPWVTYDLPPAAR